MSIPAIELMTALRSGQATSPRLTWYGPDSERVELSGRVLDNWVAKTANLLQDELDAEPGMRLRLDLPAHWKSVVLALAAWQLGMEVVFDNAEAELLATSEPGPGAAAGGVDAVLAVPLPALAMRWPGELPGGVLDYAAEVRSHGDVFMPHVVPESERLAVRASDGTAHAHGALLDGFAAPQGTAPRGTAPQGTGPQGTAPQGTGLRLLLEAASGLEAVLAQSLGTWQAGGSVVLVHPEVQVTGELRSAERVSQA